MWRASALVLMLSACATPTASLPQTLNIPHRAPSPALRPYCADLPQFAVHARTEAGVDATTIAGLFVDTCARGEIEALATELIAFPTVSAVEKAADGPAFTAMAAFLRDWAAAHGLAFQVSGANDAWEVTLGEGPALLTFITHGDVVPITEVGGPQPSPGTLPPGWTHPPFAAEVVGDRLYGRGADDDKGPIAAVLVVLSTLKALGVTPHGAVKLVIGTGEEDDWDGMHRYAEATAPARFNISVDADYPVIVGEDGFVIWELGVPVGESVVSREPQVVSAKGGEFLTQVPGEAWMRLIPGEHENLTSLTVRVLAAARAETEARDAAGGGFSIKVSGDRAHQEVEVRVVGKAAHSSVPEEGKNALWPLSAMAARLHVAPRGIGALLLAVHDSFDGDLFGTRLGLAYEDELMGALVVSPDVLRIEQGVARLAVNMRRPRGMTSEEFGARLDRALTKIRARVDASLVEVGERYVGTPVVADLTGPLVPTLMHIYRTVTGDERSSQHSIRGGTYARLFPGAVSFGPAFPGMEYTAHAADEYTDLNGLTITARMLLAAIVALDELAATAPAP